MTRAEYMRERRARGDEGQRARNSAEHLAARWLRENHPDIWKAMLREARIARGLDPDQKPGRPKAST